MTPASPSELCSNEDRTSILDNKNESVIEESVIEDTSSLESQEEIQKAPSQDIDSKHQYIICHECDNIIKGSYVEAAGKQFHSEHFRCCVCSDVIPSNKTYMEFDNKIYCEYHYLLEEASKCVGCEHPICHQVINVTKDDVNERWHPECYMINKSWSVKLGEAFKDDDILDLNKMNKQQRCHFEKVHQRRIFKIWTDLSTFEKNITNAITDMLLGFSVGDYTKGTRMANFFVSHLSALFTATKVLARRYIEEYREPLPLDRESTLLCKKLHNLFTHILDSQRRRGYQSIEMTDDIYTSVTETLLFTKIIIHIGLKGSVRLAKRDGRNGKFLNDFLNEAWFVFRHVEPIEECHPDAIPNIRCRECHQTCVGECFKYKDLYWHFQCLRCHECDKMLHTYPLDNIYNADIGLTLCFHCNRTTIGHRYYHIEVDIKYKTKFEHCAYIVKNALQTFNLYLKYFPVVSSPIIRTENRQQSMSSQDILMDSPNINSEDERQSMYSQDVSIDSPKINSEDERQSIYSQDVLMDSPKIRTEDKLQSICSQKIRIDPSKIRTENKRQNVCSQKALIDSPNRRTENKQQNLCTQRVLIKRKPVPSLDCQIVV
ncbi:uncharacterized protein BX663DRAFT_506647 [Cokeromyces recurvatus]|uniref:uncharacterized protein n=1 Tax=Cokeromyces recurvatus TaxID=90255 RepID=UPI00222030C2|nr:uncharacterized protein BX663DRAFT_506647 [Cokeromyces recurvatus]KAI7903490.1 hypothetical protein BX663DRAFT_506647 [Cokeromyces recurvatus]